MEAKKKKKLIIWLVVAVILLVAIIAFVVVFVKKNTSGAGYKLVAEDNGQGECTVVGIDSFFGFGDKGTLTIPAELDGKKVTEVDMGESHEFSKDIKKIVISEGIETIYGGCFDSYGNATEITLPKSLKKVEEGFMHTATKVNFAGNDVYEVKEQCLIEKATKTVVNAFAGAKVPEGVTAVGANAFAGCTGLGEVDLSNVEKIGTGAFSGADLTSVTLKANVSLGDRAFDSSSVKEVHFLGAVSEWGNGPFVSCQVTDVYFSGTRAAYATAFEEQVYYPFAGCTIHCSDGTN